jgi:hypothetical protein
MGASEQHRFVEAARNARTDGGVETAANMLSGLAMFDILPALATLDHFSRDRVLGRASSALSPTSGRRPSVPGGAIEAGQFAGGLGWLFTMNAAAIQALDEVAAVTSAVAASLRAASTSKMGRSNSPLRKWAEPTGHRQWRFLAARSGSRSLTRIRM